MQNAKNSYNYLDKPLNHLIMLVVFPSHFTCCSWHITNNDTYMKLLIVHLIDIIRIDSKLNS